jgi:hypothetical protein
MNYNAFPFIKQRSTSGFPFADTYYAGTNNDMPSTV